MKDVDFGLTFPIAAPVADEEALAIPPNPQTQVLLAENLVTTQNTSEATKEPVPNVNSKPVTRNGVFDANTSAKRRKLNSDGPVSRQHVDPPRPVPSLDIFAIPNDDAEDASAQGAKAAVLESKGLLPTRVASPELGLDQPTGNVNNISSSPAVLYEVEQVTESPTNAPGSGHRARVVDQDLVTSSQLQNVTNSSPSSKRIAVSTRRSTRREISASPLPEASIHDESALALSRDDVNAEGDSSSTQPTTRPREGRRKSDRQSVLATKRRRSVMDADESANISDIEAIDDRQAAAVLGKHYANRNQSAFYRDGSPDLDNSGQSVLAPAEPTRKITRRTLYQPNKKQARGSTRAKQKVTKRPAQRASVRSGSPIPVTVHRLTKLPSNSHPDSSNMENGIPHARRPGVNAVDVLSQVCTEIIDSGLNTLEEGRKNAEDNELRREYKTKWSALKSFGSELQSRLLSHVSLTGCS